MSRVREATRAFGLEEIYTTEVRRLTRIFAARGVGPEEARDLAQETITRALLHLQRHGQRGELSPLLTTIARNLLVERARRVRPHFTELSEAIEVADPGSDPSEYALSSERIRFVEAGLASLSSRHRRVVRMWMEGLGPAQIARELGIKRNAADALLHRARRRLASSLRHESLLGLVAFGLVGLRARLRRAAAFATSLDPTGAVAPSGAGMAAIGLAAVLAAGSVGAPALRGAASPTPVSNVRAASADHIEPPTAARSTEEALEGGRPDTERGSGEVADPEIVIDLRERRVAAGADPDNPTTEEEEGEVGIDVWQQPDEDEDERGTVGPLIEEVAVAVCEDVATSCEERR